MPGGRPVAMTVEQRADYSAAQHAVECLVLLARLPLGNNHIAFRKAAHVQTLRIRGSTTKASEIRRVSFLNAFHLICTWHLAFSSLLLLLCTVVNFGARTKYKEQSTKNKVQRTKY